MKQYYEIFEVLNRILNFEYVGPVNITACLPLRAEALSCKRSTTRSILQFISDQKLTSSYFLEFYQVSLNAFTYLSMSHS